MQYTLRHSFVVLLATFLSLTLLLVASQAEVLLEVDFNLSHKNETEDGYSPADAMNAFLESEDLKWLRYYVNFVSGKPGPVRMRTSHMMFKDIKAFGQWSQTFLGHFHSLFDHFWIDSRRTLWLAATPAVELPLSGNFPKRERGEGVDAGYVYQFLYSVLPGKENEFKDAWARHVEPFIKDVTENPGFLERAHYTAVVGFRNEYQAMEQYEFTSMPAMMDSIFDKPFEDLVSQISKYTSSIVVHILQPGEDEAYYWPAEGADKAPTGKSAEEL